MIQTTTRGSELFPKPYGFRYLWSEATKGTEACRLREQALLRREQCAIAHGNFLAAPKGI